MPSTEQKPRRRFLDRLENAVPGWLSDHPLRCGMAWVIGWTLLLVAGNLARWTPVPDFFVIVILLTPVLTATIVVLQSTPRQRLQVMTSVFSHFFTRFVTLVLAFLAWSASIVLGAAVSVGIQRAADHQEDQVVGIGLQLLAGIGPIVATLLWISFVLRCAWFLGRVRGWREVPARTDVPPRRLGSHPRLRQIIIGWAHPGLLLLAGGITGIGFIAMQTLQDIVFGG